MLNPAHAARRALPSVDRLLNDSRVAALVERYGRPLVVETLRALLERERELLARPSDARAAFDESAFLDACAARLAEEMRPSLKAVFNLTGTVLHTNLGRAVMPQCAADAVMRAMTQPVNLEFDLDGAARGERDSHIERWLTRLTGAEAAAVVNNNAAAVYLTLNTLALKKEVLVSRGELIEIGGAFRIPDIMARSGCKLIEVGTTNRTHLKDYAEAIGAAHRRDHESAHEQLRDTGLHRVGPESDLAALAHEHALPFIVDLGSGMLVDLEDYGLPHEPTPREALAHGADIVTFSGDKLLGGPQAGLIVGRKELIARIKKNPMKRALRVDKMTLAGARSGAAALCRPRPAQAGIADVALADAVTARHRSTRPRGFCRMWALRWGRRLMREASLPARARSAAARCRSNRCRAQRSRSKAAEKSRGSALQKIAAAFRALPVPVVGRIKDAAFLMDLRCLDDEAGFVAQLGQLRL